MLTAISFPSRPVGAALEVRLADWSLFFRTCKVCGRVFLAKSQKYTMCSDKCRQKMKTQAKRDFDARALENEYDHIYKMKPSISSTTFIVWKNIPSVLLNASLKSDPLMRISRKKQRKEKWQSRTGNLP